MDLQSIKITQNGLFISQINKNLCRQKVPEMWTNLQPEHTEKLLAVKGIVNLCQRIVAGHSVKKQKRYLHGFYSGDAREAMSALEAEVKKLENIVFKSK